LLLAGGEIAAGHQRVLRAAEAVEHFADVEHVDLVHASTTKSAKTGLEP
jgi:hypothetical protein